MFPEILEPFERHSFSLTVSVTAPSGFKRATPTRDAGSHGPRWTLCTLVPIPPQEHGFPTSQGQALQLKGLKRGRGHSHQPLK